LKKTILVSIFIFAAFSASYAQWIPSIENSFYPIYDIIGTSQNKIIVSTKIDNYPKDNDYLRYSDNLGNSWKDITNIKLPSNGGIGLLGRQGVNLFGLTSDGILKSTDDGKSWNLKPMSNSNNFYTKFASNEKLAIFSNSDSNGKILLSEDNGDVWNSINVPSSYISGIAVRSDTIFISSQYRVLKGLKTNGTWLWSEMKIVNQGFATDFSGIAAPPNSSLIIVSSKTNGTYFISNDNGVTWKTVTSLVNAQNKIENATEHIYSFGKYLILVTPKYSGKIFISEDKGLNWKDFSSGLPKAYVTNSRIYEVPISKLYLVNDVLFIIIGNNVWKRPINELATNYLETPTFLKADTTNRNTHTISWLDNSEQETEVIIEKSIDNVNNFKEIGRVLENSTSFTDFNQNGGKTYYYRLIAINKSLKSRASELITIKRAENICKVEKKLVYGLGIQNPVFVSNTKGFAFCGDADIRFLITTENGGETWSKVNTNNNFALDVYYNIAFLNDQIGFIFGRIEYNFITIDGGKTWRKDKNKVYEKYYNQIIQKIPLNNFFINDSTGFNSNQNNIFRRTGDSGKSWVNLGQSINYVQKIYFTDQKHGFISEYSRALRSTDGGNIWKNIEFPFKTSNIVDLSSPDGKSIYYSGNKLYLDSAFIAISKDNGVTFNYINVNLILGGGIFNVSFWGNKAWILSTKRDFYVSEDGLKTWKLLSDHPALNASNMSFNKNWGLLGFNDYLQQDNNSNEAYMTYDGGISWINLNLKSTSFNSSGPRVKFFDELNAVILTEDFLIKTNDKGKNWTEITLPFSTQQKKGNVYVVNFATPNYWQLSHRFNGENEYSLYKTTDGGSTWQVQPQVKNLFDKLYFYDENIGVVLVNGVSFYKTTNGGKDWKKSNVILPLNSNLSSVFFKNKNEGYLGAGSFDKTIMLKSNDGGETWKDIGIPVSLGSLGSINEIKFLNNQIGYAITQYGTLYTDDTGLTWKKIEYIQFLTKYSSLINFDELYFEGGGSNAINPIYKYHPISSPPNPHQPNGDIDACLSKTLSSYYIDDKQESSFQWQVEGGTLTENRNKALVKWNSLGNYKLKVKAINDCGVSDWQEVTVKVEPSGTAPKLVSGNLNPCSTIDSEYKLNIIAGETFKWIPPSNAIFQINNENLILKPKLGSNTFKIGVVSNLKECPSDTLFIKVETKTMPAIPTIRFENDKLVSSSLTNNQWFYENKIIENENMQSLIPKNGTGKYSVKVTNECGASSSISIYRIITGIEDDNLEISIFPNPTFETVKIEVKNANIKSLILNNSVGIQIFNKTDDLSEVNFSNLPTGIYFLRLEIVSGQIVYRKIVKQ
jgi:photosystem II stability/assembly factor-like uncharacterized protein